MTTERVLSIVLPVYNEAAALPVLHARLIAVLEKLPYTREIIYVDDGSRDLSFAVLRRIASEDSSVSIIRLSRNFGHQIALTAGLDFARGAAVITLDADLQMPPESIPDFVAAWEAGARIVAGRRIDGHDVGLAKRLTSRLFYAVINKLSDVPIEPAAPDFRLIDRAPLDVLCTMREKDRFLRGMVATLGYEQHNVEFRTDRRFAGESQYSLRKMVRLGLDALLSFSIVPLRVASVMGILTAVLGGGYGVYVLGHKLIRNTEVPGWTSTTLAVLVIGGMILLSLGIVGEYIARIYRQLKGRPIYVVDSVVNAGSGAPAPVDVVRSSAH